ncbi:hypothetical protein QEH59_13185 [Coraliomargarita sp. SDUM461004]|uniref:MOSC domain-containing protein n=1 Tax=Thalassobacterium sedimentorum TaxID=3041258 RepID=A0ABU1AKP2_9BACT|nr:hypothetical protein [Coraliomargarita sp. SDUM461004]MDQ8195384.1 hypothetical protein [Coraliomargarita sp. SDUM461004]
MNTRFMDAVRWAGAARVGSGHVDFLVNRPVEGVHESVDELYLDVQRGILGDRWSETAWLRLPDGRADPRVQVSLTNTRVMQCFTGAEPGDVFRCGDNIYTDLNLSMSALPPGARLQIDEAVLEVSDVENDACGKFVQRFGVDAFRCVRAEANRSLRLRGIFCSIVRAGRVRVGASLSLLPAS